MLLIRVSEQMHVIPKSEFDRRVTRYFTPEPDDRLNIIKKYRYEAYMMSIEDLINESIDDPTYRDLMEPVYVSVVGPDDIDDQMKIARDLSRLDYLHGLILIDVDHEIGVRYLRDTRYRDWKIEELHWFNRHESEMITETDNGLDADRIRHIGLHGHIVRAWDTLRLYRLPVRELSMRTFGISDRSLIGLKLPIYHNMVIIDIELSDQLIENLSQLNNIPDWRNSDITSELEQVSLIYSSRSTLIPVGRHLNTLKILGQLSDITLDSKISQRLIELQWYPTLRVSPLALSRFSNIESINIRYESLTDGRLTGPWNRLPHLRVLHLFGPGIRTYRDNFDQIKNLEELKIN